ASFSSLASVSWPLDAALLVFAGADLVAAAPVPGAAAAPAAVGTPLGYSTLTRSGPDGELLPSIQWPTSSPMSPASRSTLSRPSRPEWRCSQLRGPSGSTAGR